MQDKLNIRFRISAVDNFSRNMNKLHSRLENVKRHVESLDNMTNVNIGVSGDKKAKRQIDDVGDEIDKVKRKSPVVITMAVAGFRTVQTNFNRFRRQMGYVASFSRDVGEIISRTLTSSLVTASSTGVAAIGALGGVIGSLGPIIGASAGQMFSLVTAFGAAGIAAVGFGALAGGSIGKVIEANSDLKDLREELANTTDLEKRAEIIAEMEQITSNLTSEQKKGLKAVESLSKAWGDLQSKVEPQAMEAFAGVLQSIETTMSKLTPMIEKTADVVVGLVDAFNANLKADDMMAFFNFLNTSGSNILKNITEGLGNFVAGLLNMMTAFGPLAEETAEGFNKMGEKFREWASGLPESKKFQNFIDYIKENAPKVSKIIGGMIEGLTDFFGAFGPLAENMLDGLLDMVEGFKDWSSTLKDNEGFQKFVEFVETQGPKVLDFLEEFRNLLINIGEGFASVSETMTPFLTNVLELANGFMEANPGLSKFVAWMITLSGILGLIIAPFVFFVNILKAILAPFQKIFIWVKDKLGPVFTKLTDIFKTYVIPWLSKLWQWFLRAIPILARVAGVLLRFISGPVGVVIAGIIALATYIYNNWDDIWEKTKEIWKKVSDWISDKWDEIKTSFAVVSAIYKEVKEKFEDMKDAITTKMSDIWDDITDTWNDIIDWLSNIDLYDIGASIMEGMVNGVKDMGGNLVESAKGVVGNAIEGAKNLLNINSPSKVFRDMGYSVGEGFIQGMDRMAGAVKNASVSMTGESIQPLATGINSYAPNSDVYPSRYNTHSTASQPETQAAGDSYNFEGMFAGASFGHGITDDEMTQIERQIANNVTKAKRKKGVR